MNNLHSLWKGKQVQDLSLVLQWRQNLPSNLEIWWLVPGISNRGSIVEKHVQRYTIHCGKCGQKHIALLVILKPTDTQKKPQSILMSLHYGVTSIMHRVGSVFKQPCLPLLFVIFVNVECFNHLWYMMVSCFTGERGGLKGSASGKLYWKIGVT